MYKNSRLTVGICNQTPAERLDRFLCNILSTFGRFNRSHHCIMYWGVIIPGRTNNRKTSSFNHTIQEATIPIVF